mmetsp:Transcript_18475/g.43371  ORF Transcript_18475/g.43371 Transcript_18475/m.43371 type:complete len:319 (-) Transcript_18475:259-1215(-)
MTTEFEGILDHYAVLGLDHHCSGADIRKAFRAAALKWHPDKAGSSPDARRRFQEAADAYEVLCDAEKRQAYDATLVQQASQAENAAGPRRNENYATPNAHGHHGHHGHPQGYARQPHAGTRQAYSYPRQNGFTSGFASDAPNAWRAPNGRAPGSATRKDTRPTAAELHPQGFGPAFRASMSDLQTLATFCHERAVWQPKVKDVKWCRPDGDARRVQLSFIADYTSSRSRGNAASPLVQLLQTSTCDALHTSFQEHLDRVAGRCDCRHFRMQLLDFPGRGELQFRVKLWLEGETAAVLHSFDAAWELAPSKKMKDCPLM